MKRLVLLLTLLAGVTFAVQAQTKPAEFKFESAQHEFGKVTQGKPVTVDFKFVNSGEEPLIIKTATAECGCTTPVLIPAAGTPIKKGEKGVIRVTYNAAALGQFTKRVNIVANTATPTTVLTIKGEVAAAAATSSEK